MCHFWEAESIGIVERPKEAFNNTSLVDLKYDWTLGRYQVNLHGKQISDLRTMAMRCPRLGLIN